MHIKFNPVMASLLAALPLVSPGVIAAERGQIVIDDPTGQTHMVLNAGDTVTYPGSNVAAIDVSGAGNTLRADGFSVNVTHEGLISSTTPVNGIGVRASSGAVVSLGNGDITARSGPALVARGAGSTITANNLTISSAGVLDAVHVLDGGSITLTGVHINQAIVNWSNSGGLSATGANSTLTAIDSLIELGPLDLTSVSIRDGATVTLDNTRVTGSNLSGAVASRSFSPGQTNTLVIRNGSNIDLSSNSAALNAVNGRHRFLISDSTVNSRGSNGTNNGLLLYTRNEQPANPTEHVLLDATHSTLTGDILSAIGAVDVALKSGSTFTGATRQRDSGTINQLAVDATSTWNVRNDSVVGTLDNAGTVAFVAPSRSRGFKTLTVNHYVGGGTLVLNTQLGDDSSGTDRLVIDGGTTSGNTSLRILNSGGSGQRTQVGIRVVQTLNGGTTTADAFHLDAGSTGYRASARTLALNGYEYSLVRGGQGGAAPDWYLTSDTPPVAPVVPVAPVAPVTPVNPNGGDGGSGGNGGGAIPPSVITRPGQGGFRNVSPESGAYLGNRLASARFLSHSLNDRSAASGNGGAVAYAVRGTGADGANASADNSAMAHTGRGLWTRVEGRQDSGLRMAQGRVGMDTDSTILQMGGDLIKAPLGQDGAVYAGLMGGYGDARTTSTSALRLPDGATVQARARGKVSGYSVGLYGTVYQNDATRMGAYADTWLQFGRYANQINSELGSARYRSTTWSASIEAGYAVKPFADGSTLGPVVVEPHAQLIYSRYDAQDATLQGTRLRSGSDNAWNSRIGVRLYPQVAPNAPAVRPFLEANWLHSFGDPSVNMGPNTLDAALSRNSLELKLGAEGQVSRAVQVAGHVFGQASNNNQRGYGGMVNLGYRW